MSNTILIEITNQKAVGLLRELEELHLIKVLNEPAPLPGEKLSDKYKGIISAKEAKSLNEHVKRMRNEWNAI